MSWFKSVVPLNFGASHVACIYPEFVSYFLKINYLFSLHSLEIEHSCWS